MSNFNKLKLPANLSCIPSSDQLHEVLFISAFLGIQSIIKELLISEDSISIGSHPLFKTSVPTEAIHE